MNKLKYLGYSVVFQEVPDEVSLAINISGCPHKCEGCHSEYLWAYEGNYISDDIDELIDKYEALITCVCFMGGDQNLSELICLAEYIHSRGLKVAIYSGIDDISSWGDNIYCFDYIKIGHYDKMAGPINKKTTNQKMFQIHPVIQEITNKFWR